MPGTRHLMSIQRHSLMHTTCCSHIGQQRKINVLTVLAVSLSMWKKTIDRPIRIKIKAGPNQHRIEQIRKVADVDEVVAAAEAPVDESGTRNTWEILTWIIIALTILLNLALVAILVLRRNLHSIVNKSEPWVGG